MTTELVLDAEHRYWVAGKRVQGVTEILAGLNLIDTRWFTEESRIRGTAVHAAVHYFLDNDLDWKSIDPRIRGYVDAAVAFLTDARCKVRLAETRVLHEGPPTFAGTPDFEGEFFGDDSTIDWKSGALSAVTGLQLAGYDMALGGKRRRRIGVQLRPNGTYKKTDFTDYRDYPRFLAAADLHWRFVFDPRAAEKSEVA